MQQEYRNYEYSSPGVHRLSALTTGHSLKRACEKKRGRRRAARAPRPSQNPADCRLPVRWIRAPLCRNGSIGRHASLVAEAVGGALT
eukprot:6500447-Pyramimonas_sp.AAC.1